MYKETASSGSACRRFPSACAGCEHEHCEQLSGKRQLQATEVWPLSVEYKIGDRPEPNRLHQRPARLSRQSRNAHADVNSMFSIHPDRCELRDFRSYALRGGDSCTLSVPAVPPGDVSVRTEAQDAVCPLGACRTFLPLSRPAQTLSDFDALVSNIRRLGVRGARFVGLSRVSEVQVRQAARVLSL